MTLLLFAQLWDVNANKLVRRMHTHDSRVNSLAWNPHTNLLSSASQSGTIHNYDVRQAQFHINSLESHSRDVCGLRWSPNGRFLASGGDSNVVCIWDTHSRDPWTAPAHILREHTAAVKVTITPTTMGIIRLIIEELLECMGYLFSIGVNNMVCSG